MKYSYMSDLPYNQIMVLVKNEAVDELWIVTAFFSSNKLIEILVALQNRKNRVKSHIIISASSVNPLQDVVDSLLNISNYEWFDFHLVDDPLMHSKLFAARTGEKIKLYIGSANLTNKAANSNIESGVFLEFNNNDKTVKYLSELMDACRSLKSLSKLQNKAILSHFRSELLFLALEESKIKQSISMIPVKIKNILAYNANDNTDKIVTMRSKNILTISILDIDEQQLLLQKEFEFKTAIKTDLAIKLEGYGYVSSLWSISHILNEDSVNVPYKHFIDGLIEVRSKYCDKGYRRNIFNKIKELILSEAYKIDFDDKDKEDKITTIKDDLEILREKFLLPVDDKKSPYRKIETLYGKLIDSSDIVALLNPYKIVHDDTDSISDVDDIKLLNTDQINLLVMCQLAIKLRSLTGRSKSPKPPSVWWFDIALDKRASTLYGFQDISAFKADTRIKLESIILDIQQNRDIDECVTEFCRVTGFNLGIKYPTVNNLMVWLDEGEVIEDGPYVFLCAPQASYNRYNLIFHRNNETHELMLFLDTDKIIDEWELDESPNILLQEGEFTLGNNLYPYYDPDLGTISCLSIDSLQPHDNY